MTFTNLVQLLHNKYLVSPLHKWIFYSFLALLALAYIISFALISFAEDNVKTAQLRLEKQVKQDFIQMQAQDFAKYEAQIIYPHSIFNARSRSASNLILREIKWTSGIDSSDIHITKAQNRYVEFTTTQNLSALQKSIIAQVSYEVDFSPLLNKVSLYGFCLFIALLVFVLTQSQQNKYLSKFAKESLPQILINFYKSINPLYRHTFWIVFIACNVVFGFNTIHFLWGSDDWNSVLDRYGVFEQVAMGRYTQNLITLGLTNGLILPLLNNILGFVGLSLGAVWLCMYFNIQRNLYFWVIIGLLLTLQPFTLTRIYYFFQVAGLFIAVAIGILGFVLAKKAGEYNASALVTNGGGGRLSPNLSYK